MTAVHQFVPALLPRDATGDHTLALREAFRAQGWQSDIYVEAAHDELQSEATYFEEYTRRSRPGDILVYQASTGSPVAEYLLGRPETLVLDYHNITPASFYAPWEPHTAEKVTEARRQVAALAPRAALGVAHSQFNAAELASFGCPSTVVVPILVSVGQWSQSPDPETAAAFAARADGGTVVLFVGRLSPNKAQHELVQALWLYRRWYDPDGPPVVWWGRPSPVVMPTPSSTWPLSSGLAGAVVHGEHLTSAELAAWYGAADVFVCLSDHEGFCIPLLEAMQFDLPIVAFAAGAVPETVGPAGVLLEVKRPSVVAAAIDRVRSDAGLASSLVALGRRRLSDFEADRTRNRFVEVLQALEGQELCAR